MHLLPRVLGAITAAYSVAIVVRPEVLARPCGLTGPDDRAAPDVRTLIGGIGVRDIAIGTAMVLAPRGPALRTAVAARVLSDAADAAVFGLRLPARDRRPRIVGFALTWAALCALSGRWAG
ncbi:MAG: hypothetical protein NTW05_11300 [Pseudonocardiales bacterium]|nr:hypothetical protein [Pseudonocardiales bacterium]